jgi:hypothetical protein
MLVPVPESHTAVLLFLLTIFCWKVKQEEHSHSVIKLMKFSDCGPAGNYGKKMAICKIVAVTFCAVVTLPPPESQVNMFLSATFLSLTEPMDRLTSQLLAVFLF